MNESALYHAGNRTLQDMFDSRRMADRMEEKITRAEFTEDRKSVV